MNIPNCISLGRLLVVPAAVWLILSNAFAAAFWVFVIAGLSDAVDGFIAKRFHMETELGRFLDPLADKVLLVCVYVTLGVQEHLPLWLVILVVSRDVLLIGGTMFGHVIRRPLTIRPLAISKMNTAAQITLAAAVIGGAAFEIDVTSYVDAMVWLVGVTTVASGTGYVAAWARHVTNGDQGA